MVERLIHSSRVTKLEYRYEILFVFVLLEVLLYDSKIVIQPIVSLIEYAFVLFALLLDRKLGVMYFISFTLLSLGSWSYVIQTELPNNFWGIRLAGLSLNFFFSVFLFCYCLCFRNKIYQSSEIKIYNLFFYSFIIYAFIVGVINTIFGINYPDNLLKDTSIYLPFFIYIYLLSLLDAKSTLLIVKNGISLTIVTMLLSLITGHMFQYSPENYFLLMNSYAFIILFLIFFLKKIYSTRHFIFLVASTLIMLASGRVFIGGKFIIITIMVLLWLGLQKKKVMFSILVFIIVLFLFIEPITEFLGDNFSESLVITHKFTQVFEIFKIIDIDTIASTNSSMGNIFAEAKTTFYYLWHNTGFFIFGKGLGGGIQDVFGYFKPLAGPDTGYTYNDVIRNDYFRMHLPIFEISIKTGIGGFLFYLYILAKAIKATHIFSFAFFILLFTVFFNSKEMMLLTLLFMKVSTTYTGAIHEQ